MEKPTEYTLSRTVTRGMTAAVIGRRGENILSTPMLIDLVEAAAIGLMRQYFDESMTSVGAEIRCRHLAATPVGMQVRAVVRLRSLEGRKAWFDFETFDENGKCGEGEHLRFAVPQEP